MDKKILKKIKKNRGVTGIDASIAVTILMIFVPLITTIISNTINVKEKINRKVIATNLAIQAIESVKQISALDEGVISNQVVFDGKKGGHYVYGSENFPKGYTVEVEVKKGSSLDKNVTVTVTVTYQNNIGDEELVFTTKITK